MICMNKAARLRIGLAGLGTVGAATLRLLQSHITDGAPFEIVAVNARDPKKDRQLDLTGIRWVSDPAVLAQDPEIDLFIELIGGSTGPAAEAVKAALQAGKHVVTANKALLAYDGVSLATLAEQQGVVLRAEASVAGAIPILQALRVGFAANKVSRIAGILNGTCNYILTEMAARSRAFATVLHHAQQLGYAEADPSFDVDGIDTAHKLTILAMHAFGQQFSLADIPVTGIRTITLEDIEYAKEFGYAIKLLAVAHQLQDGQIALNVAPHLVPHGHLLSHIDGVRNAVLVEGNYAGPALLIGRGAGGDATASAVVSDVLALASHDRQPFFGQPAIQLKAANVPDSDALQQSYYLRCDMRDAMGVMAELTGILKAHNLSIDALQMPQHKVGGIAPIILTLQAAHLKQIRAAIEMIKSKISGLMAEPLYLPIFEG